MKVKDPYVCKWRRHDVNRSTIEEECWRSAQRVFSLAFSLYLLQAEAVAGDGCLDTYLPYRDLAIP